MNPTPSGPASGDAPDLPATPSPGADDADEVDAGVPDAPGPSDSLGDVDPAEPGLSGAELVERAMAIIDRRGFLPKAHRRLADGDHPLPIGRGQTSSQPTTVANMLELLEVAPGMDVLDIGSGSGWTTAILAHLVGPSGSVLGLELVPELTEWGAENLAATQMPWARIDQATPGALGRPREGGYDRILVSAGADRLPETLVEQIGPGGLMVIPVDTTMLRVERTPSDEIRITEHGGYMFVPLID